MSSAVEIANQALTKIGADRITSFSDETTPARVMSTIYEPTKTSLLRSYPWNCAIKREKLAQLADEPLNEFPFQYQLPEGFIKLLDVWAGEQKMDRPGAAMRAWAVEGDKLLTHDQNLNIKYVANIESQDMDAHVEEAFVAKLASEASYAIQASNTNQDALLGIYQMKLDEARTTDNLEQPHTIFRISRLQNVRY